MLSEKEIKIIREITISGLKEAERQNLEELIKHYRTELMVLNLILD